MSDFPTSLGLGADSKRTPTDGQVIDYGDDGTARVRILYEKTQWTFNLTLPMLTSAEVTTLLTHYANNRLDSFTFTWPSDSAAYTCQYLGPPIPSETEAVSRYDYTVNLAGVAA